MVRNFAEWLLTFTDSIADYKYYIDFETIYKTPVSWHEGIGKISFEKYKEIIKKIKEYYKIEDLNTLFKEAKAIKGR